jgi:uncharacterized protein (DUF2236 family)
MLTAQAPASADIPSDPTHFNVSDEEKTNVADVRRLGPDSLIWDRLGDLRGMLTVFRIGLLQNMHPAVSRALEDHSGEVFLKNPWNRLLRSLPPIMGVIYAPDPGAIGRKVRDYHVDIKGTLQSGQAYHALSPDLFFWTHATFVEGVIAMSERFGTPLTECEQVLLYDESIEWYRRYGLSMRPVPPDYASFKRYWADMLDTLQPTRITEHALKLRRTPRPFDSIPRPVWWLIDPFVNRFSQWLARGTLPLQARSKLGLGWSALDERLLRMFCALVRVTFRLIPKERRYLPMVRAWRAQRAAATPCPRREPEHHAAQ